MLPPRLIRRLVLAPLTVVTALALIALFPLLALVAVVFGLGRVPWILVDAGGDPGGVRQGGGGANSGAIGDDDPGAPGENTPVFSLGWGIAAGRRLGADPRRRRSAGHALVKRVPPGRMRGLRLLWFAAVWLIGESLALVACLGLWVASGFGWRLRTEPYRRRHYAVLRWFLALIYRAGAAAFGVRVEVAEPEITARDRAARPARPVIVLSRHAGPGDSILLVHHLLGVYGRRPRVVMKAALQLDPVVDVLGNRLPNAFISRRKTGEGVFADEIDRLARGLGPDGALVIFPEGGNWTPGRWRRAIQRLERNGHPDLATRAGEMPNVLAPRAGGVLAAISACPTADVIFVAHAGLDRLVSMADIWRGLPAGQVMRARWWRVPCDQVPRHAGHKDQVRWLYDWWQLIDGWISGHRPPGETVRTTP